jgi:branched-chain amino acid transport system permease protein
MIILQVLVNGILLGGIYACIAAGFSLVWGVINVINILHGSLIIIGSYVAFFAYSYLGIHPFLSIPIAALLVFGLAYLFQAGIINRVVGSSVLTTLTVTFGLDLFINNLLIVAFKADYRKVNLETPLGVLQMGDVMIPGDRVATMFLAFLLTGLLYWVLRTSRIGRAIIAVRMDPETAALLGVRVKMIYSITFGLGGAMAAAAGSIMSVVFPISAINNGLYLSKAFVVCVLGGLGSVSGAMVGGLALGIIESFGGMVFGPEHAMTLSFVLLILLLLFRPSGIMGKKGYE